MKKYIILLLILFSGLWVFSAADAAIIVGRISHLEGQIYRYMDVDDDWVETFLQSPVGTEDILTTGDGSRAEIAFPNDHLVRLDENTEFEVLNLDEDVGEFTLHSGLARFYNRSPEGKLLVETARGTLRVEPGSIIDVRANGDAVTVFAVRGEGTFFTYQDGEERMEVISGSTRLEFRGQAVAAARGSIDRNWDRWCGDREDAWSRNSLVRSEHLPDTMQEYAYAMEPYGAWQRIYYRGYYYWAWRPHSVEVGWSPYTTGYWYDWRDSPVWIDHNPWGWVTHHHGHWINLHGGWLWTPYVHVSHVPGVTVIGFNITFGKRYRPHWHPGRVRWIAHNEYVGWLPLAPWETYYGYRNWGPRSVLIGGGTGFSININLSNHQYIGHAVIIPKHHLHHGKARTINNYNTVKIKNINKTVIVNNYKPLTTAERERDRSHAAKVIRTRSTDRKIEIHRTRGAQETRKAIRNEKNESTRERTVVRSSRSEEKTTVSGNVARTSKRNIDKRRFVLEDKKAGDQDRGAREKVVRTETRSRQRVIEKKEEKTDSGNRVIARDAGRRNLAGEEKVRAGEKNARPARVETSRKRTIEKENKTVVTRENRAEEQRQRRREPRVSQKQEEHNQYRDKKTVREDSRNRRAREETAEDNRARQAAKNLRNEREESGPTWNNRQRSGRDWYSATLDGKRFR